MTFPQMGQPFNTTSNSIAVVGTQATTVKSRMKYKDSCKWRSNSPFLNGLSMLVLALYSARAVNESSQCLTTDANLARKERGRGARKARETSHYIRLDVTSWGKSVTPYTLYCGNI